MTPTPRAAPLRAAVLWAAALLLLAPGSSSPTSEGTPVRDAGDLDPPIRRGRDPLDLVRTTVPPRVWILLDTSISMDQSLGDRTRLEEALRIIRWAAATFESDTGAPLVHWRLATFRRYGESDAGIGQACRDPNFGASLPRGSPPGSRVSPFVYCGGLRLASAPTGCDLESARAAMLRKLPRSVNAIRTPAGIALYQLALYIANTATADLLPGQRNVVLFLTDGMDSCECRVTVWRDFVSGDPGVDPNRPLRLRLGEAVPTLSPVEWTFDYTQPYNAGLKAKAALHALNLGDPSAALGDIHVVGIDMESEDSRAVTNHLAWMASDLQRPALHAADRAGLRAAVAAVLGEVTLPRGWVKLAEPRLATVKELVALTPGPGSGETPVAEGSNGLVADPADPESLAETLALRAAHRDNVFLSASADLGALEGRLAALPVPERGGVVDGAALWDAGALLEARDPDDRQIWFHRPGETLLRPFTVDRVTPTDLGVDIGYLSELDGVGARSAADAAEIVVRLIRGEELALHPDSGSIYRPDGALHFVGGAGTPKLRESLASPAVVTSPPNRPERGAAYQRFFSDRVNRRTMVYLPTSGGMLHAFSAGTGDEVFAFVPADVLGPATGEGAPGGPFLRDLAVVGVRGAPALRRGLVSRYSLAGSPVARDIRVPGAEPWRTVLAFGRSLGGRVVTTLDVTAVGGTWSGTPEPPSRWPVEARRPRLLWNRGGSGAPDSGLPGLGETPEPVFAEVPARDGGEWVVFQSGGSGVSDVALFVLAAEDGRLRQRLPLASAPGAPISPNEAPTAAVVWRPGWATPGASNLVSAAYVADLHGQIHRLDTAASGGWALRVAHRLGADHPVQTRPVAFPFPGRVEPHLLVVTGGDRRLRNGPSDLVLLRDLGTHFDEVWRRALPEGEAPQGRPVVQVSSSGVAVVLPTIAAQPPDDLGCSATRTNEGVSRLRAFNGMTGAPLNGLLGQGLSVLGFGAGRLRGVSMSGSGNMAYSVTQAGGDLIDTVIGDFRFRVRDSALEPVTLFVESFRRSPF